VIIVRPSKTHGLGLFAVKSIAHGEVIGTVEGEPTHEDGEHVLWLTPKSAIRVQNELKYINHSHYPNVAYYDDLTVVALRDIAKDEELTHDYGEEWK